MESKLIKYLCYSFLLSLPLPCNLHAADLASSFDHPQLGRVAGTEIVAFEQKRFDQARFQTSALQEYNLAQAQLVFREPPRIMEGKRTRLWYEGAGLSGLELIRQYQSALVAKGFSVVYDSTLDTQANAKTGDLILPMSENVPRNNRSEYVFRGANDSTVKSSTLKRADASGEIWLSLITVDWSQADDTFKTVQGAYLALDVIEQEAMQARVEVIPASKLQSEIDAAGKVALYGIFFDSNQATLKTESAPSLAEIAKLLQANPTLKLHVVGHTDNQGGSNANIELSKRRADAVKSALVSQYAVAEQRLSANGVGYLAPVASNTSELGRAKNRRVELVPF